jgi:hypothetical protein
MREGSLITIVPDFLPAAGRSQQIERCIEKRRGYIIPVAALLIAEKGHQRAKTREFAGHVKNI